MSPTSSKATTAKDPQAARAEIERSAHLSCLLALARDHESRLALAVEDPHTLVHLPRQEHAAVHPQQVGVPQAQSVVPDPGTLEVHTAPSSPERKELVTLFASIV